MIKNFKDFLTYALSIKGKSIVVVQPHNEETLSAVVETAKMNLAEFHLVGTESIIRQTLNSLGSSLQFHFYNEVDTEKSILKSFELIHNKTCDILMKGSVDTSTLMKSVFDPANNLRSGKLFSDVFIFETHKENKLLMITDGGLNLSPNLDEKISIIQNAIKVAHALGNTNPKVALLSASEKVNPKLQSSVDAAEITKLNRDWKITGCVIEGPMALDVCVSEQAAAEKNIRTEVAGKADIIVAPNIEAANSLAKSTQYFAGLPHAQVIVGGKIPILIPSRADKCEEKVRTIALGVIMSSANN
ncbi:MAG: phosphate acyltransferase [Bacteroidota bacterium]|nr:phosphate acyltransferase [Bacteroidota bacterium]